MRKSMRLALALAVAVGMAGMTGVSVRGAEEAVKKGSVSGTVVDKDGKGVAEVKVMLMKPMGRGGRGGGPGGPGGGAGGGTRQPQAAGAGQNGAIGLQEGGDKPKPGGPGAGGEGRPPMPEPVATATTDKDGKFEMKDVPVGPYMLGVRDQDKKVFGRARVEVKEGETATVEIKTSDTPPQRGGGGGGGGGQGGGQQPK